MSEQRKRSLSKAIQGPKNVTMHENRTSDTALPPESGSASLDLKYKEKPVFNTDSRPCINWQGLQILSRKTN